MIGLVPSRGAYLFSSSIMVNSRLPGPAASLRRGLGGEHHADDEPLRPLGQVVQVDHGDLLVRPWRWRGGPGSGRSPRISGRSARSETRSRRMNALTVPTPVTGPAQSARVVVVGRAGRR